MPEAACIASQASPVAARPGPRSDELARRLAAMTPRAAILSIRLQGPNRPWPHTEVQAEDAEGHLVLLSRTQQLVAARLDHPNPPRRRMAEPPDLRRAHRVPGRRGGLMAHPYAYDSLQPVQVRFASSDDREENAGTDRSAKSDGAR